MVNIGSKPDQNKDFAAEEERYHDFDDIVYDINLIPEEEKRAIVETENSKLIQCLQKNSNLSLTAKFELFDMLLHRTNLV